MKHWTPEEKVQLKKLKAHKMSDGDCGMIMKRSEASIRDMWVKLQDSTFTRNNVPWTVAEDMDLRAGMKNKQFQKKYQRGQKVTNQRRFDLNRPKGRFYNLYRSNNVPQAAPLAPVSHKSTVDTIMSTPATTFKRINRKMILDAIHGKTAKPATPYQLKIVDEMFNPNNMGANKFEDLKTLTLVLAETFCNI